MEDGEKETSGKLSRYLELNILGAREGDDGVLWALLARFRAGGDAQFLTADEAAVKSSVSAAIRNIRAYTDGAKEKLRHEHDELRLALGLGVHSAHQDAADRRDRLPWAHRCNHSTGDGMAGFHTLCPSSAPEENAGDGVTPINVTPAPAFC